MRIGTFLLGVAAGYYLTTARGLAPAVAGGAPLPNPAEMEARAAEYLESVIAKAQQWGSDTLTGSELATYERWIGSQSQLVCTTGVVTLPDLTQIFT